MEANVDTCLENVRNGCDNAYVLQPEAEVNCNFSHILCKNVYCELSCRLEEVVCITVL